jgi:ribosomal protein S4E
LKKHLKRLNAPKHWMLDKLGGAFVCLRSLTLCCNVNVFLVLASFLVFFVECN